MFKNQHFRKESGYCGTGNAGNIGGKWPYCKYFNHSRLSSTMTVVKLKYDPTELEVEKGPIVNFHNTTLSFILPLY